MFSDRNVVDGLTTAEKDENAFLMANANGYWEYLLALHGISPFYFYGRQTNRPGKEVSN